MITAEDIINGHAPMPTCANLSRANFWRGVSEKNRDAILASATGLVVGASE